MTYSNININTINDNENKKEKINKIYLYIINYECFPYMISLIFKIIIAIYEILLSGSGIIIGILYIKTNCNALYQIPIYLIICFSLRLMLFILELMRKKNELPNKFVTYCGYIYIGILIWGCIITFNIEPTCSHFLYNYALSVTILNLIMFVMINIIFLYVYFTYKDKSIQSIQSI
jgi:hypothetical protein